jgi:hypothetical protein
MTRLAGEPLSAGGVRQPDGHDCLRGGLRGLGASGYGYVTANRRAIEHYAIVPARFLLHDGTHLEVRVPADSEEQS